MERFLTGRRVLVVEDEMLVLLMIEGMLGDLGCASVLAASTVDSALALIGAEILDAAILDMNLGGHKTDAVADALAARAVPYVFATGYGSRDLRAADRDRPMLKKPFQEAELTRILRRLLSP